MSHHTSLYAVAGNELSLPDLERWSQKCCAKSFISCFCSAALLLPGVLAKGNRSNDLILGTEMPTTCDSLFYCIKAQCLSDTTQSYFEVFGDQQCFCA